MIRDDAPTPTRIEPQYVSESVSGAWVREWQDYADRLRAQLAEARRDAARLRGGLQWYADGNHYELPGWEDCSGESSNWLFPPDSEEPWMIDDGGVAQSILAGHSINPNRDEDENITIPPAAPDSAAPGQQDGTAEGRKP